MLHIMKEKTHYFSFILHSVEPAFVLLFITDVSIYLKLISVDLKNSEPRAMYNVHHILPGVSIFLGHFPMGTGRPQQR